MQLCEEGIHLAQNVCFIRIEDEVIGILQSDNLGGWQAGFEGVYLIDGSSVGDLWDREDGEYRDMNLRVLLPAELDCSIDGLRSSRLGMDAIWFVSSCNGLSRCETFASVCPAKAVFDRPCLTAAHRSAS